LGHKVHPTGFRLGIIRDWQAKWYSDRYYSEFLLEDLKLRRAIRARYPEAGISLVELDRQAKDITIILHTARPGIVIGRGGQRVDEIRLYLEALINKRVRLNIQEIRQPELDAYLVARNIAEQIERRIAYRRAMRQAIFRTMQAGAQGIKVSCSGRLGNAEIARRQTLHQGRVPLHTLRADIDYGFTEAHTTLGRIGVKVWIYKGEILPEPKVPAPAQEAVAAPVAEAAPPAPETPAPAATGEKAVKTPEAVAPPAPEAKAPEAAVSATPGAGAPAEEKPKRKTTRAATTRPRKKTAATGGQDKPETGVSPEDTGNTAAVKEEKDVSAT